jgi:hypothetical protein
MLNPTLFGLLSQIERDDIVLPAMQRPFVWREDRIYRLIDSLLRGFPIGAVMLWRTSTVQRFRRLPRDVDTDVPEVFTSETSTDVGNKYLILDGPQRLTSLFAAFKGSYGHKRLYAFPPEWLFSLERLTPPRHPGRWVGARGCGRDEHRCPPPAQIRTSGITAYGSSLGYERRSVRRDMDEEYGDEESTCRR